MLLRGEAAPLPTGRSPCMRSRASTSDIRPFADNALREPAAPT